MTKRHWILAVIFVMVGFAGIGPLIWPMNNPQVVTTATNPYSLEGVWTSDKSDGQSYMVATVANDTIDIVWHMGPDTEAVYWSGSCTEKTVTGNLEIVSANNTDVTSRSMYASNSPTKTFAYSNGTLSFVFQALGATKTVTLRK